MLLGEGWRRAKTITTTTKEIDLSYSFSTRSQDMKDRRKTMIAERKQELLQVKAAANAAAKAIADAQATAARQRADAQATAARQRAEAAERAGAAAAARASAPRGNNRGRNRGNNRGGNRGGNRNNNQGKLTGPKISDRLISAHYNPRFRLFSFHRSR